MRRALRDAVATIESEGFHVAAIHAGGNHLHLDVISTDGEIGRTIQWSKSRLRSELRTMKGRT
jgi:hypothetical protein